MRLPGFEDESGKERAYVAVDKAGRVTRVSPEFLAEAMRYLAEKEKARKKRRQEAAK